MFTDPIQITVSTPPDKFLGLTSTVWAAISSLIAGLATVALLIYNWRYIHWTRKLSETATTQASIAQKSLERLEEQIISEVIRERHSAMAIQREAMNRVMYWSTNIRWTAYTKPDSIKLIPEDWNELVSYFSRHIPDSSALVTSTSQGLHNVEGALNSASLLPMASRGPANKDAEVRFKSLETNLDDMRKRLTDINAALQTRVVHTPTTGQIS